MIESKRVPRPEPGGSETTSSAVVGRLRLVRRGLRRAATLSTGIAFVRRALESSLVRRVTAYARRGSATEVPEPLPDTPLDIVDLASWESFPASDPPGYR